MNEFARRAIEIVESIPRGRVTSYGVVATLAGSPRAARAVGSALRTGSGPATPWHRVVSAQLTIVFKGDIERAAQQRALLLAEGVAVDATGRIERAYAWGPDDAEICLGPLPPSVEMGFSDTRLRGRRRPR
ncbi:MAG: MGMT family protein [Myxococcales bacterium]|nr:MGMT family protein [Myxococcales bacterium]MCB9520597.1 MGMT family protein [Myxococcales bacterium]MCB9531520.1 MGMT family protein [Myxococcales bacterium]